MKSLFEQLKNYGKSSFYPYHMPGHKRSVFGELPSDIAQMDITEIEGFDNLHQPEGVLKELQERAARIYGSKESFYLVNGSTCGILSAISAAIPRGGHILMARGSHKSAYHAAYLRNLRISYLYAPVIEEFDICDAITPGQVEMALAREPDIGAVFLVSPTYEGRIADIERIARIVHERGIPLIVDEAHGAHLGMAEGFAENSCSAGADIVINSVHKTLPAMTQTALLHVNGDRISRDRLCRFLHIYQTSSPSYILMASIDNALRVVSKEGQELFERFKINYTHMLEELGACRHLEFLKTDGKRQDIGKLVISAREKGISGQQLYDYLLGNYQLQLEMASSAFCLAMFTIGDGEEAYIRMTRALLDIDRKIEKGILHPDRDAGKEIPDVTAFLKEGNESAISFAEAWDKETIWISVSKAAGCNAGEFLNLYPPGIPLLVPGERIEEEHCRCIMAYAEQNLKIQGIRIQDTGNGEREYQIKVIS